MVNEYRINKKVTINEYLSNLHLSKSNIYKLLTLNAISTNNRIIKNNDFIENEIIYINFSLLEDNSLITPVKKEINVIYEDDNFIAIDKNPNVLIHSDGNTNDTLLNYIVSYLQEKFDDSYVRPIHRIDYEASGVCLFSKNILAQSDVSFQMENNLIYKRYYCIVNGIMPVGENKEINVLIGKDRHNSKKYAITKSGKASITKYKVIKNIKNNSLLDINIITGRPHQIRVTLSNLGYPIVGDKLYNEFKTSSNLKLLSYELKFSYLNKRISIHSKKVIDNI